jgi:predicted CopG family antitoxin
LLQVQQLPSSKEYKMIRLTPEAYDKLTALGQKNESYSQLIVRLVDHYLKTIEEEKPTKSSRRKTG